MSLQKTTKLTDNLLDDHLLIVGPAAWAGAFRPTTTLFEGTFLLFNIHVPQAFESFLNITGCSKERGKIKINFTNIKCKLLFLSVVLLLEKILISQSWMLVSFGETNLAVQFIFMYY